MLIDSHCHLDFGVFDDDRAAILSRCEQQGITRIIVPGVTAERWSHLLSVTQDSDKLYAALGLHPMFMAEHTAADISQLNDYVSYFSPIAIGEIGLDFYLEHHDKSKQIALFEQQLELAVKFDLPVILHVRKAHDVVIQLLKKHRVKGGIVHALSGSHQQALLYIQLGFLLGIGGTVTYDKATRIRQLFSQLPLPAIALETDAPDMPLQGQRSQRNSPESLIPILGSLADLRTEAPDSIAKITTHNVTQLFALPSSGN
ncbi:MAG: TatD family hydrolase [Piscirickettsiaceae bacterium]|nr:TatD family hydrolase [Piscirickettsiaceae bacterium]